MKESQKSWRGAAPGEPLVGDRTRCCCQEEAWPLMRARRSAPRRAMSSTGSMLSSGWKMSRLGWSLSSTSCVASRFTCTTPKSKVQELPFGATISLRRNSPSLASLTFPELQFNTKVTHYLKFVRRLEGNRFVIYCSARKAAWWRAYCLRWLHGRHAVRESNMIYTHQSCTR